MTYVIKTWYASPNPDVQGNYVVIEGRNEGWISFVLSWLKIEPTVTLIVGHKNIQFIEGSFAGFIKRVIPFGSVSSMLYGYSKPWKTVIGIAIAGLVLSFLFRNFFIFILGIIIAFVVYFLNKKLTIAIVEDSGAISGIEFKRSVIEGNKIDEQSAATVINIIQSFVDAQN